MVGVRKNRWVSSILAAILATAALVAVSPTAQASNGCEEATSGGEFDYELVDGTALVIEGQTPSALVLNCDFEGQVGDYIRYDAHSRICVPIRGRVDVDAVVDPDGTRLKIVISNPNPYQGIGDFLVLCGAALDGRMTGGGWAEDGGSKVTMGLTLPCTLGSDSSQDQNLQVNWDDNAFHLENPETSACFGGDYHHGGGGHHGQGLGRCNGEPAEVEWSLEDGGTQTWSDGTTSNFSDYIQIEIDGAGDCQLVIEEELYGGQLTLHVTE